MFPSTTSSSKILIAISLDPDESKELLSWAIRLLAHPNDSIVAIPCSWQHQIRQAKAHVISVLGEFASSCQSKQINLEAKVGFSSSVGRGLIEEAEFILADFLLLHGSRNRSSNKHCFENSPEGCTIVSVGKRVEEQITSSLDSANSAETHQLDSKWLSKNTDGEKDTSPVQNHIVLEKTRSKNPSPRTVFDQLEEESNSTEDDTFSFEDSSIISQSPLQTPKFKGRFNKGERTMSPYRLITSFLSSPLSRRNRSLSNKEKHQPLLKCFSYEEISNATNNFHSDNMVGQGGYSEVYKGNLSDGRTIAVKRLAKDNKSANKEKEFLMELGIIGHVCHPNTATLVGCCIENGLYLIFNFSQNGNLESALHEFVLCLQIADFGLAKWLPNKWTHHAAKPFMESGNITELIDPSLEDKYDSDQMHRLVLASAYCVRQSSAWRPSMSEVLELLTKGHDSEAAKNWRMPKCTSDSDELNDFSMFFGYHVPTDIDLEEFL
ncbi:hypothetical protein Patl1_14355 [Pistacia atlantica]|uniref:Uncharacterized protein n=1 Tax=Pistacia atlantica TaxID=434234 RepID=A0ACC1ATV3_9ROSI|nr:hypothetical protein Patl1_14355 [Pistacia atlantica]